MERAEEARAEETGAGVAPGAGGQASAVQGAAAGATAGAQAMGEPLTAAGASEPQAATGPQPAAPEAGQRLQAQPAQWERRSAGPTEGQRVAAVLSDDRDEDDLFLFEKTWGHRLLAGLGFVMLIAAVVLVVYFAMQISKVQVYAEVADWLVTMGYVVYGIGLAAGVLLVPPGILAVLVAKRPWHARLAVGVGVFGLLLVAVFVALAFALEAGSATTIVLVAVLLAVAPVVYLVASVKVLRSNGGQYAPAKRQVGRARGRQAGGRKQGAHSK